jgi:C4-type Zn-finger protein
MDRKVDINEDAENIFSDTVHVFRRITISKKGLIIFKIEEDIKPYIFNLTSNFTQYYFENIARLKSSFSIRIYELLKQYEKIGNIKITVESLRHFLNIDDIKYKLYGDFKRKTILVAQAELKEKTDVYFEFEEKKIGNKVIEINFIIFKNEKGSSIIKEEKIIEQKLTVEQEQLKTKLINQYKFSGKIADDLVLTVSIEQIEKNITYSEKEFKEGKITKNFNGFLLKSIKNNYAGNLSLFEIAEKTKQEQEKKKAILDSKKEALISKLSKDFGTQERKKFIESLTEDQEKQVISDILKEVELDAYTTGLVKKKGLNTPAIYLFLNKRIEGFAENREVFIAEGLKKAGV